MGALIWFLFNTYLLDTGDVIPKSLLSGYNRKSAQFEIIQTDYLFSTSLN